MLISLIPSYLGETINAQCFVRMKYLTDDYDVEEYYAQVDEIATLQFNWVWYWFIYFRIIASA